MENKNIKFSVIIPVFNEEGAIKRIVFELSNFLRKNINESFEVIVVNDGSTDNTGHIAKNIEIENYYYYKNPYNKGYGAALKLGTRKAGGRYIIFYDGDGQHNPKDVLRLINEVKNYDMVVGSRQGYKGPLWRQPGKKIISTIANYLVNFKIPDLNSGLRVVGRDCFNKFIHLYPNGFSLSTTITLAFLKHGYSVKYIPIKINKREGNSSLQIKDGLKAINLVLRMIMLFSPLKIFLPISAFIFSLGFISLLRDVFVVYNINDNTVLLLVSSLIIFFFGLIADQLAAIRREMKF